MVTRVVEVVNVLKESWNVTRLVEDGNQNVLLAVCRVRITERVGFN